MKPCVCLHTRADCWWDSLCLIVVMIIPRNNERRWSSFHWWVITCKYDLLNPYDSIGISSLICTQMGSSASNDRYVCQLIHISLMLMSYKQFFYLWSGQKHITCKGHLTCTFWFGCVCSSLLCVCWRREWVGFLLFLLVGVEFETGFSPGYVYVYLVL